MMRSWPWPWRQCRGPVCSPRTTRPTRRLPSHVSLHLEILEDRLVLSTTLTTLSAYEQWRQQKFTVGDVAALDASQTGVSAQAMQGTDLIGMDKVFADYGYRGQGYSVAVIDTGIDYNHAALGNGWGKRVIAGWNFVNNTANPMDDNGHGTHVAGIIGSSDATYTGVAPNVNFIALKVLDAGGSGTFGAVEDALKWVVANQQKYNIVSINLSVGAGSFTVNPYAFLDDEFAALKSEGVFIAVAAGNSYYTNQDYPGLAFPAIDPNTVSVGAVWPGSYGTVQWFGGATDYNTAADHIASFSQRGPNLDLLSPGAMITSTYKGGGFKTMSGTSMATPFVAGAAVLLHQQLVALGQSANQDYILSLMQSSGVTIHDGEYGYDNVKNTGLDFKRLDLSAAMHSVTASNTPPTLAAISNQTMAKNQGPLSLTLAAADADGDALTLSAQTLGGPAATVGIAGNQLIIAPAFGYSGSFQVIVTASDGRATASRSFTITVANAAPVLDAIASQTMVINKPLTLSLPARDPDGDALTFSAQVPALSNQAYQVKQYYGLTFAGSYRFNSQGARERWLLGKNNRWYIITPNGQLRKWLGSMAATMTAAGLMVKLDASYYNDPSKLWNARPTVPATATISGNQLTLQPLAGFSGNFTVQVTASDGLLSATRSFTVSVLNYAAPTLNPIAPQTIKTGQTAALSLSAANPAGLALSYSASVPAGDPRAYQLKQDLGLLVATDYYTDAQGLQEKWLQGKNGSWYMILANGEVRRWGGTLTATMAASALVATLDSSYYVDPSKLWNAQPAVPAVVTVNGNQLVIRPGTGFVGTFTVSVTLSDGITTSTRSFQVTVVA